MPRKEHEYMYDGDCVAFETVIDRHVIGLLCTRIFREYWTLDNVPNSRSI